MHRYTALCVALLIAAPVVAGEMSIAKALQADRPMNWSKYEIHGLQEKLETVEQLGLCVEPNDDTSENFHLVDIDGDGGADVVYEGHTWDCGRVEEPQTTKLFVVRQGSPQLVFRGVGSIRAIWRDTPEAPISFILRDDGCCADTRVFYGFYAPEGTGPDLKFTPVRKLMRADVLELPDSYLDHEPIMALYRPTTALRGSPETVDEGLVYPLDDEVGTGNVVARFPKGTSVTVISSADRADGQWLMVAGPVGEAEWLLQSPKWFNDSGQPAEVVGWMKVGED